MEWFVARKTGSASFPDALWNVSGTLSLLTKELKHRPEQRRSCASHFNRKWGLLHFKAPWRYQICIFKCLYYYRDDLFQNLGKTTVQKWKNTTSGWSECVTQKCLCLSSLFIDYYEVAQETGANDRPQKLLHGAITQDCEMTKTHLLLYFSNLQLDSAYVCCGVMYIQCFG